MAATAALSHLPDVARLASALAGVLGAGGGRAESVELLERRPNVYGSTFPSELIACRIGGREYRLFCKYSGGVLDHHRRYGHRGGVGYEAAVYRAVLSQVGLPAARFYGAHVDGATGETWMFLEDLGPLPRAHRSHDPGAMGHAARWAGAFHAAAEGLAAKLGGTLLRRYDTHYYRGWCERTAAFARPFRDEFPWLTRLCERFPAVAPHYLLAEPATVIHGEYYPANVLWRADGTVIPVDWESAVVAAGEIDLASLTENWPEAATQHCAAEYARARWPGGATPPKFDATLDAARVYLHLRWLGYDPTKTAESARNRWRFDALRDAAGRIGLL
jgi:hypothetical protein